MPHTDEEIAERARVLELNRNLRASPAPAPRKGPQNSLHTVLTDQGTKMSYAEEGGTGVLLVQPGAKMGIGAAIKFEDPIAIASSNKCGQLMEGFFDQAKGTPPFLAPRTQVYGREHFDKDAVLAPELGRAMSNVPNRKGDELRLDRAKTRLAEVKDGKSAVLVMEFAKGEQLNNLPTEDKVALFKGEAFAQNLGRAMAPSIALHLLDHAGTAAANASNFMYHPESGTLSVIDYETRMNAVGKDKPPLVRYGRADVDKTLRNMRVFLEKASASQENFEAAITQILQHGQSSQTPTPFDVMAEKFIEQGGTTLFQKGRPEDQLAQRQLLEEDKRRFVANLLVGAAEGLEYLQTNQQALENAVKNTHQTQVNPQLDHFYSKEEMAALKMEMGNLNASSLKSNLAQRVTHQNQIRRDALSGKVTDLKQKKEVLDTKLANVEKEMGQITQRPTAGDKMKVLLLPKQLEPLTRLNNRREKLQGRQRENADQLGMAVSDLDYHNKMEAQSKLVRGPSVAEPGPKVNAPGPKVDAPKVQGPATKPGAPLPNMTRPGVARFKPKDIPKPVDTRSVAQNENQNGSAELSKRALPRKVQAPSRAQPREVPLAPRAKPRVRDIDPTLAHAQGQVKPRFPKLPLG